MKTTEPTCSLVDDQKREKTKLEREETTRIRIETRNLSFYYGESQALHEITMPIPERSVTALIGPSGCGKSTFLRTLNRMNDLIDGTRHEGQVLLDNQDIRSEEHTSELQSH